MSATILYVDDEFTNLELFKAHFKKNFNVITADSAIHGLEIIRNSAIDIVITDLKMPIMNGFDFIKEIKKTLPALKCIVLSGYIDSHVLAEKEHTLVHEFIMKPWRKDEMLVVINRALGLC